MARGDGREGGGQQQASLTHRSMGDARDAAVCRQPARISVAGRLDHVACVLGNSYPVTKTPRTPRKRPARPGRLGGGAGQASVTHRAIGHDRDPAVGPQSEQTGPARPLDYSARSLFNSYSVTKIPPKSDRFVSLGERGADTALFGDDPDRVPDGVGGDAAG
jgi:hypothetical protein